MKSTASAAMCSLLLELWDYLPFSYGILCYFLGLVIAHPEHPGSFLLVMGDILELNSGN